MAEFKIGDIVETLRGDYGILTGTRGEIVEIYGDGEADGSGIDGYYVSFPGEDSPEHASGWDYLGSELWRVVEVDPVDHPDHYGGKDNPYEAIKVIEAWALGFSLGNAIKYISRAGKKGDRLEDLKKAKWYLEREIESA